MGWDPYSPTVPKNPFNAARWKDSKVLYPKWPWIVEGTNHCFHLFLFKDPLHCYLVKTVFVAMG